MRRITLTWLGLTAACGGKLAPPPAATEPADASVTPDPYAAECAGGNVPPASIECTGLYADVATKKIAPGVRAYAPAVPLWADGASKNRWIFLPPGTTIDASYPNEWTFPSGTKVWKEFTRDGKRVETRMFEKIQADYWVRTTYAWNADETAATVSGGGDMPWGADGGVYHIPTPDECDQCHRGRTDRLLGFEQVSLGLDGATGLTLPELVAEGLITPAPSSTRLTVGDDGTGAAAAPLAWLHINCGVSCHNDNSNSTGYGANMRLRLDPAALDGRSSAAFPSLMTTVGVLATTPTWSGLTRIVPGDAKHSLLAELITNRGTDNPVSNQMPPIASLLVDTADTQAVIAWIDQMPKIPSDGGSDGAGPTDAGGIVDARSMTSDASGASDGAGGGVGDASDASDGGPPMGDGGSDGGSADAGVDATVDDAAVEAGSDDAADDAQTADDVTLAVSAMGH